ncbi:hypothetical protein [Persephonella sp.]
MKYIVCPKCQSIEEIPTTNWRNVYREIAEYEVLDDDTEEKISSETEEFLYCYHSCGFESNNYGAEDFMVEVDEDNIKWKGSYWYYNEEELEVILQILK